MMFLSILLREFRKKTKKEDFQVLKCYISGQVSEKKSQIPVVGDENLHYRPN